MKTDDELERWRQQWQAQPQVPIDLIRKVERQTAGMKVYRFLEVLVTVVMGGGSVGAALIMRDTNVTIFAIGTVLAIALAWRFALKHTRGLWEPSAPTTASYIDLSIRRCHWKIADTRYDAVQGVVLTAFVCIMDYRFLVASGQWSTLSDAWWFWILSVVIALVLVAVFESKRKKARNELSYLTNLQEELKSA
jgi:hypothetical protein